MVTARWPQTNSTRHPCLHFLDLAQQDAANLAGASDVRTAASGKIEIAHLNQPQLVALRRRQLAQTQFSSFFLGHETNLDGTVLGNHFVRQKLGGFHLLRPQCLRIQIDRAVLRAHVKGNRGHLKAAHKGRRKHMLPGVLLHVIAPPSAINHAMNAGSLFQQRGAFQQVKNRPIFLLRDLRHAQLRRSVRGHHPTRIKHLPATGGIKRRTVEHHGGTRTSTRHYVHHLGVELPQK